jgi:hypothetical protein
MEWLQMGIAYGPLGVLTLIVILIVIWHYKTEKRVVVVENKSEEHSGIHKKHSGYHSRAFDRITSLENKDVKSDGEFKVIDSELKSLGKSMDSIQTDVKTILNHFAEKGMG